MTPERFRQVRNLFEAAMEREPAVREAYVIEASEADSDLQEQVKRLLAAHDQSVQFLDGALTAPAELRTDPRRMEGRRLGAYEILREVGRGGMGTVYLARRADGAFEQKVAIKIVTPETGSDEVLRRFVQERSILAGLEHPNIARLYDGGATEEGWPYFVMEFVEGEPIDRWCDQKKLNVSERVRLFRTVCAAVHYAHQQRVVHRDLKPGNILVSADGTVKLLDFGIAKLVRAEADEKTMLATRTGVRMMTPEYASPEQIRSEEATPATDVYSLGVILYELLTGRRPYRLKSRIFHEIVRVVCEEAAVRPSTAATQDDVRPMDGGKTVTIGPGAYSQTREGSPMDLKRRLAGDLDNIVLKALEKDARERYRSVEQFSQDLERHINGQPVMAQDAAVGARVGQWLHRYRMQVAIGLGLCVALATGGIRVDVKGVALVVGAIGMLGLWHAATDRELGPKISERMNGTAPVLVTVTTVAFLLTVQYLSQMEGGRYAPSLRMAANLAGAALPLYISVLLVAWWTRNKWAGELVTKMETVDPLRTLLVVLVVNTHQLFRVLLRAFRSGVRLEFLEAMIVLSAVLGGVYVLLALRNLEVRGHGILYRGRMIPWLRLEGYEWESTPQELVVFRLNPEKAAIRLKVQRLFSIFPGPKLVVPSDRRDEMEAILKRHLSAWPE